MELFARKTLKCSFFYIALGAQGDLSQIIPDSILSSCFSPCNKRAKDFWRQTLLTVTQGRKMPQSPAKKLAVSVIVHGKKHQIRKQSPTGRKAAGTQPLLRLWHSDHSMPAAFNITSVVFPVFFSKRALKMSRIDAGIAHVNTYTGQ